MGELVPTPPPPDPVQLAAIAMAAQRIVAEEMGKTKGPFVTAEEAGAIARKAVVEAFGEFDIDLDRPESIRAFNATIASAERSRAWWDKAANTVWNGIWAAIAAGAMAVFAKYMGGPR
ncbi:hypothetical protein [Methylobacterium aquaticum]|uniref:Uncharacterized protein n=1 Tax=Methylobacterium aquaticum TaxID=270351 RepID=A0A0C6FCH2_9HYPH|nr:hypothetical protein [Methylobacterium aquaticum]BAQ50401.1 hypothetical protein Maq22A_4p60240 [Methylobacterium aquaticum]